MDKKQKLVYAKSVSTDKKTVTALVSTYDWDRMEERFAKGAWRLDNFKKNPVVLWAHNQQELPIAKAISLVETDMGLMSEAQFDDQSPFAMQVFSLYERGFLNAFSVGFWPNRYEVEDIPAVGRKGTVWTDAELMEYSAVPVPANPGAVVPRESAELIQKILGEKYLKKSVSSETGQEFLAICNPTEKLPDPEKGLEHSLKSLIDIAKIAKNEKLDEQKLSLIKTSLLVLNELVVGNEGGVSSEQFKELKSLVEGFISFIKKNQEDPQDLVTKFMIQLEMATRGYRGK